MFKDIAQWTRIRRRVLRGGISQRQMALETGISRQTVRKMLKFTLPPGCRRQQPIRRPKLGPWIGVIDQIVKEDGTRPKKQRNTAKRIWQRLCEEQQFSGGYTIVKDYLRRARFIANADTKTGRQSQGEGLGEPSFESEDPAQITYTVLKSLPEREAVQMLRVLCFGAEPQLARKNLDRLIKPIFFPKPPRFQRNRERREQAFEWMRHVLQGAIPLDILTKELRGVPLSELEGLLSAATGGRLSIRNKSMTVLGRLRGISYASICCFLQISKQSSLNYWKLFREGGAKVLFARKSRNSKKSDKDSIKRAVFTLLHSPPAAHGINRTTWRMVDLQNILCEQHQPLCSEVIRRIIKEAGYKWRRARIVLTSKDPDYRTKVEAIKKILSELGPDEAFFSIDEYGPFAVKKKGGIKRVAPGQEYVVPQWQKSKGWMILTAALELSRNQVSHFYSRQKNTDEMVKMADLLRAQYRTCSTIYLSWDAASWHMSKKLVAHLKNINHQAAVDGFPVVKTAPLPAGAQFLNVIESVFSGMARAIIHNSDYPSVEVARDAIDRYFNQRNEHFSKHPKRAGQKIWGKERVPSEFAEGQNCKDPLYQ
ncbi:MAG: IS630 family transposase [Terriglobales bacterium]